MRRRIRVITVLVALLVVLSGCTSTMTTEDVELPPDESDLSTGGPDEGMAWEVTITHVFDGDTVEARFPNGEVGTLRLLGVDSPETSSDRVSPEEFEGIPDTEAGRDHLLTWGERASAFATDELEGEQVRIAVDPEADRRGGYDRLLVYVYTDGNTFNERLLEEGYARLYDTHFVHRDDFASTESAAREQQRGLWAFDGTTSSPAAVTDVLHVQGVGDTQDRGTFGAFVNHAAYHVGVGEHDRFEVTPTVRTVSHT